MEVVENRIGDEPVYHCVDPAVFTVDNLLTDEECSHMINVSKPFMKSSLVSTADKGVESIGRTSSNAWIKHDHDEITQQIGEKIANIVGLPLENAEAYQVIYYGPGGQYRPHYDSWVHDGSEKTLRCMKYGGARLKTALVYLNDVEEGGSTSLDRLNLDVQPKKGKLLVFENTYSGSNIKHPLSLHAGMPVIKGEKYAFNLWFKECNSKKLYSEFNPEYYKTEDTSQSINKYTQLTKLDGFTKISEEKQIYKLEQMLDENECKIIMDNCEFANTSTKYVNCWVNNNKVPDIINKIEERIGIKSDFFENMQVFKYSANQCHGPFMEAYDITSENGKKHTGKRGQRIYTITIPLNNKMETQFVKMNETISSDAGSMMIYDNILANSKNVRNKELEHTLFNKNDSETFLLNIYIREKDLSSNILSSEIITSIKSTEMELIVNEKPDTHVGNDKTHDNVENYKHTFESVLIKFENNEISRHWRGLNSFNYTFKGYHDYFTHMVSKYINTRVPDVDEIISSNIIDLSGNNNICFKSALNMENLKQSYTFDEFNPVTIENVLIPETLAICQEYYSKNIQDKVYALGDKQSQRFKSNNEPLSRILHYEVLPLIEKVVGKSLRPSYTYLSAYVKGSDLPAHTDRADCEYTVSFLINKPENSKWPIYLHKVKQPVKYKGRADFTPSKDECFEIDCNAGGLMMFSGTDHVHFREELPDDFYHIVLLHYCSV